jgi:hypothetical protein
MTAMTRSGKNVVVVVAAVMGALQECASGGDLLLWGQDREMTMMIQTMTNLNPEAGQQRRRVNGELQQSNLTGEFDT